MHNDLLTNAARLYQITPDQLTPLSGGHFTHVFQFTLDEQTYVLRITPPNADLDYTSMRACLEWMDYLARHGASIPRPVASIEGNLIERLVYAGEIYLAVAFEKIRGVLAEEHPIEAWDPGLIFELGKAVEQMHSLARSHAPEPQYIRPEWDTIVNCFHHPAADGTPAHILQKKNQVMETIKALPKEPEHYGLVHSDLHFGNIFAEPECGKITLFDFDDCCYGWYVMDLSMILFDALVLYQGTDREAFAARFFRLFLDGYCHTKPLAPFWLDQVPTFLTLLELNLYCMLWPAYDRASEEDAWVASFMKGRKERIENDVPYVRLELARL